MRSPSTNRGLFGRAAWLGLLLSLCASVFLSGVAKAHTGGTTAYASISVSGQAIRYTLTFPSASLLIPPGSPASQQPGGRPDYRSLLNTVREKVTFKNEGKPCNPVPAFDVPSSPTAVSLIVVVDFLCSDPIGKLTIRDDLFDAFGADYHTLAKIESAQGTQQFAFTPQTRETVITVQAGEPVSRGSGSFFLLGIEHILSGYDHLLFLTGLLLCGGGFVSMLKIITAFTLAHSVTLALAVLNIVTLPNRLVEAAIALSIAYVAAENLFRREDISRRWAVSFLFGLMHGFGFSSALRELGLPREGLAFSLLSFNLGVEAGQALVVAIAMPLLIWLRRTHWEARTVSGFSAGILVVGLALFIQRAFF